MLRLIMLAVSLSVFADAQLPKPATVKIISPASGVVLHPGQTVDIEVAVTGPYSLVSIGDSLDTIINRPLSSKHAPCIFRVQIPANVTPRPYTIAAQLYDLESGRINSTIATDRITLDVEPSAPPRKLTFGPERPLVMPVGDMAQLYVSGTFDGENQLSLISSTLTTFESDPPGIVSITSQGGVQALAPGSAKVTVRHQGLQASVTVTVTGDQLRITAPPEGTIVHPGEKLSVDVAASGGPFNVVMAFLAPDLDAAAKSTVQPYWLSLTVPASARSGPAWISAMGNTGVTAVFSPDVTIDIERTDPPQSLSADAGGGDWASIWVGGDELIRVFGKYPDNPHVDLTESTLTTYEATSDGIIEIGKNGWFKGLAAGSTYIVIRHRNLSIRVKVVVHE